MKFDINKNKIIIVVVAVAILALSFIIGGNGPGSKEDNKSASTTDYNYINKLDDGKKNSDDEKDSKSNKSSETSRNTKIAKDNTSNDDKSTINKLEDSKDKLIDEKPIKEFSTNNTESKKKSETSKANNTNTSSNEFSTKSVESTTSESKTENTNHKSSDKETEMTKETIINNMETDQEDENVEYRATLSVNCSTILKNMDWLEPQKLELIPENGVVYPKTTIKFEEGESVFDALNREMRSARIHLEYSNVPMYNSAYIEGINNIYEFDCGELSGWMYKVNGQFPNYGSSKYELKDGDVIEWVYTCDLGGDIGGSNY